MFQIGDLVEDNEYEGYYAYIVSSFKLRCPRTKKFVTNYHVRFVGDVDEELITLEENRLTKVS